MRVLKTVAGIGVSAAFALGCQGDGGEVALDSFADSASYAIGMNMGQSMRS